MNPFDPRFANLQAMLFDLDGTLVRTFIDFAAIRARMHALSERYGVGEATRDAGDSLDIVARMTAALPANIAEQARQEAFAAIESIEEEGCAAPQAIRAANEILDRCHCRDLKVGIVTRNSRRIALRLIDKMSLSFDTLIAREDVREFKPHPAPIVEACIRLNVQPRQAIMVGDQWTDIAAGRAANVAATIGIQWEHDPPNRFENCRPDYEISDLSTMLPFVDVSSRPE